MLETEPIHNRIQIHYINKDYLQKTIDIEHTCVTTRLLDGWEGVLKNISKEMHTDSKCMFQPLMNWSVKWELDLCSSSLSEEIPIVKVKGLKTVLGFQRFELIQIHLPRNAHTKTWLREQLRGNLLWQNENTTDSENHEGSIRPSGAKR